MKYYNPKNKDKARNLRKNMTKAEVLLWLRLRRKQLQGLQFYRQKPLGNYIVDFYCPAKKLVIEVDGGHHYNLGEIVETDKAREAFLKNSLNLKILRFTNIDIVNNISSVMDKIFQEINS